MKSLLNRVLEVVLVLGLVYMLAGCNMINGLGKDLVSMTEPHIQASK